MTAVLTSKHWNEFSNDNFRRRFHGRRVTFEDYICAFAEVEVLSVLLKNRERLSAITALGPIRSSRRDWRIWFSKAGRKRALIPAVVEVSASSERVPDTG